MRCPHRSARCARKRASIPALELERLRSRSVLFFLDSVGQYVDGQPELRGLPLAHDLAAIASEFGIDRRTTRSRPCAWRSPGRRSGPPLELLFPLLGHDRILIRIGAVNSRLLHGRGLEPIAFGPDGKPFEPIRGAPERAAERPVDGYRVIEVTMPSRSQTFLRRPATRRYRRDPAARGWLDVVLSYPGFHALAAHRLIHAFTARACRCCRAFSPTSSRFMTGIEIHPGAKIGRGRVHRSRHGRRHRRDGRGRRRLHDLPRRHARRHEPLARQAPSDAGRAASPSGRTPAVLGAIILGDGAKVGGGSVVVKDVPANATVVGIPARVVAQDGKRVRVGAGPSASRAARSRTRARSRNCNGASIGSNGVCDRHRRQGRRQSRLVVGLIWKLYNTRTRPWKSSSPLRENDVRMYVCGLTPSAQAHLGHARSFLFFDVLRRYLMHRGYSRHVRAERHRHRRSQHQPRARDRRKLARHRRPLLRRVQGRRCASSACWSPTSEPYATAFIRRFRR